MSSMCYNRGRMSSKTYRREHQRARRTKAAGEGMCSQCCTRPASPGFATCSICRERARITMRSRRDDKPLQPVTCPICGSIPDRFYWHHWEDSHPELGMWICPYCNMIVELEDRGLVDRYRELKDEATHKFNSAVLKETLNLRYLT